MTSSSNPALKIATRSVGWCNNVVVLDAKSPDQYMIPFLKSSHHGEPERGGGRLRGVRCFAYTDQFTEVTTHRLTGKN